MGVTKSVNVASKTVQRRPAVVTVRAVNLPFGLGGNKPARKTAGSKTTGSRGRSSKSASSSEPAAQSFVIRIPGQFFQSKKDVVWPISLGFTKANELFVGRMAMLGFAASLVGEVLTGKGALAQFDVETGLPLFDTEPLVLFLIVFNLFAALWPGKGKFVPFDSEDLSSRPKGALQDPNISLASSPGKFLGISGVGFTKANELFVGRVAQLNLETGIPLSESEPLLIFSIIFFALTAINE